MAVSDWFDYGGTVPGNSANLSSSDIRGEFQAVEDGLSAKLPDTSGSGGQVVRVNSGGTGLESSATLTLTGVLTASTLEATGDTSAGDNAAIGYTATEGVIITGQGSTNDVTIKNDADTTVVSIATGTTTVAFAGDITASSGTITGPSGTWDSGGMDLAASDTYAINSTDVLSATTLGSGVTASSLTSVGTLTSLTTSGDITIYDAVNDGNPRIRIGAADAEEAIIQAVYDTGAQTLDYVLFSTEAASATADKGEYRFQVDETLVATIDDGGIEIKASGSLSFGAVEILGDSAGTTTLKNIDAIDATTEATIEAAIDTLSNLTTTGALNAGSITSGFGAIDTGSSNITTTGTVNAGTLAIGSSPTNILTDSGGTTTLGNIDAIDATTEATIEAAIDTLSNLTTTGALNSGSITSGFGSIDVGSSTIDTTGTITGGTIAVGTGGVTCTSGTTTTFGFEVRNSVGGGVFDVEGTAGDVRLRQVSAAGAAEDTWVNMNRNGSVELYYDNSKTFETASGGNTSTGLLTLDQDGNASALSIDSESTSASVVLINADPTTTGGVINVSADGLTGGYIAELISDSADTSSRTLVTLTNDNVLATGAVPLRINQDSTNAAMVITAASTANNCFTITGDSLTGGRLANFQSNSSDATARGLVQIHNNHASATGAICLEVVQDSIAAGVTINSAGTTTGNVLEIVNADSLTTGRCARFHSNSASTSSRNIVQIDQANSAATNAVTLRVSQSADAEMIATNAPACATANVFELFNCNSLTTGGIAYLHSNSSSAGTRSLVTVANDHTSATGTKLMTWQQDANATAVQCNNPGNTTEIVFDLVNCNALTTGSIARFYSNSSDTSNRNLVDITNDHASATGARCIGMQQDANSAFFSFTGLTGANASSAISTWTTGNSIVGFVKVLIGGTGRWIPFYDDPTS